MHEFSLAKAIIETALAEAATNNARIIHALGVKLSKASHITPDTMEFCIRAAATSTIVEKAKMKIEVFEPTVKCRKCGPTSTFQTGKPFCPKCSSYNLEMLSTSEAYLDSICVD